MQSVAVVVEFPFKLNFDLIFPYFKRNVAKQDSVLVVLRGDGSMVHLKAQNSSLVEFDEEIFAWSLKVKSNVRFTAVGVLIALKVKP